MATNLRRIIAASFSTNMKTNAAFSPKRWSSIIPNNKPLSFAAIANTFRFSTTSSSASASNDNDANNDIALAMWFEGVYPVKLSRWDPRHVWARYNATQLKDSAKKEVIPPAETFKGKFTYLNSVSSIKEGGLLVRFLYEGDKKDAFETIEKFIENKGIRSFMVGGSKIKSHPVEGVPWIEDLASSIPSARINLSFQGPELSTEQLYNEFRKFGKIDTINIQQTAKDSPKDGHIEYLSSKAATSARVCMNGKIVGSTRILVSYEPALRRGIIFNYIRDHPRISLPIILAILTFLSFLIFDPMRVFFVTNAVTERFSVNRYLGFGIDDVFSSSKSFLMSLIFGKLPDVTSGNEFDEEVESHFMKERKDYEAKLNIFLKETPETAMLIYGPKGTRHTDLVEKCTKSEPYIMRIRLDEIINQPDHIFLDKLSRQTGCFPMFNWTVSTGSLLDTIVTATTGTKAGFASTAESQIRKIFEITTIALNRIVHSEHQKRQAALNHFQLSNQAPPSTDAVPDIEYPVIVIEGFLGNEKAKQAYVYELLTEWTNTLVEMQVAQVVFVSDNPAAVKYLSRAIPRKTIETIALADASFTSSISYAQGRLGLVFGQRLPVELEQAIYALGGRLTDLEQLVQKVKAALRAKNQNSNNNNSNGTILQKLRRTAFVSESHDVSDAALATPEQLADAASHAFNDIVVRTETEIRKIGLFEDIGVATVSSSSLPVKKEWTAVQMWKIIQLLTKFEEVSYDDLRYHPLFKGDETAIQAIERAGLISIGLHEGRPYIIRAGRPVYRTAFARLQSDKKYSAIMGLKTVKTLVNDETVKLKEYESELSTLTGQILTDRIGLWGASDLRSRANFVAKLIGESHVKLAALDAEERKLKKVVKLVE